LFSIVCYSASLRVKILVRRKFQFRKRYASSFRTSFKKIRTAISILIRFYEWWYFHCSKHIHCTIRTQSDATEMVLLVTDMECCS
jgi:hypothetical protein